METWEIYRQKIWTYALQYNEYYCVNQNQAHQGQVVGLIVGGTESREDYFEMLEQIQGIGKNSENQHLNWIHPEVVNHGDELLYLPWTLKEMKRKNIKKKCMKVRLKAILK